MPLLFFLALLDDPEDHVLFTEIFERYADELYRIALAKLKDSHDAEDAVQETFIALTKNFHKIRGLYYSEYPKLKGYLVTILENKIIDTFRYRKRHPADDYDALQVESLRENGENQYLYDALKQLSNKSRIVLILRYDLGFTPKEIAQQLNVSVWTVYKWIEQAKAALEKVLETDDEKH